MTKPAAELAPCGRLEAGIVILPSTRDCPYHHGEPDGGRNN